MSCPELLPINRGYNSSLGYLSGAEDHYANTRTCGGLDGIDFWRRYDPCIAAPAVYIRIRAPAVDIRISSLPAYGEDGNKSFGGYATYKYTAEALRVIDGTEKEQKLFMCELTLLPLLARVLLLLLTRARSDQTWPLATCMGRCRYI